MHPSVFKCSKIEPRDEIKDNDFPERDMGNVRMLHCDGFA
jgi:hypothetical protein